MRTTCNYTIESDFDSLSEKELKIIVFDCEKCPHISKSQKKGFLNLHCFKNTVKLFKENLDATNGVFKTESGEFKLTYKQVDFFLDYCRRLEKIPSKVRDPIFKGTANCPKRDDCEKKINFFLDRILGDKFNEGLTVTDPINSYLEIKQQIKVKTQISSENPSCRNCYRHYLPFLNEVRSLLKESKIIKSYLELDKKNSPIHKILSLIFGDYNLVSSPSSRHLSPPKTMDHIQSYQVGPYKINIKKSGDSTEYFYEIASIIEDPDLRNIYNRILSEISANFKQFIGTIGILKLNKLLHSLKQFAIQLLMQQYGRLSSNSISNIAELVSFELVQLNPLMATLLDDEIEEIFMDTSKSSIYLDHRKYGRCQTSISFTPTELECMKTRVRIEAEQRLDETHPFLKTEIITPYFHVRLSMEISTLAVDEFSMRIRKLHKKIFTITDLIANNTLSVEASAYLLFNWFHGRCILVIGKPYSGKTTLINSLDMLGNPSWRKIYVEDVIESIDQASFGIRQSRYRVEPTEAIMDHYSTKAYQVKECLHRTPDSVFIGELIHSDAVNAFFYLLKVGLRRCLATAHGESPELMVKRFVFADKVPATLIGHLDIIVQLEKIPKRGQLIRRVSRITEVKEEAETKPNESEEGRYGIPNLSYMDVFTRNPETDQLIGTFTTLDELYDKSNAIKDINLLHGEYISKSRFNSEMTNIQAYINKLLNDSQWKVEDMVKEFQSLWNDLEMNE